MRLDREPRIDCPALLRLGAGKRTAASAALSKPDRTELLGLAIVLAATHYQLLGISTGNKGERDLLAEHASLGFGRQGQSPAVRQRTSFARHWPNSFRGLARQNHDRTARHPVGHLQHGQHQEVE